jgi:hypothetical protein
MRILECKAVSKFQSNQWRSLGDIRFWTNKHLHFYLYSRYTKQCDFMTCHHPTGHYIIAAWLHLHHRVVQHTQHITGTTTDYHADRSCHSPSSRCLLQSAVWRHTHTPFRHSAGTWQAVLLSQCTQLGILYIIHSHYKFSLTFQLMQAQIEGEGHDSFNGISINILN